MKTITSLAFCFVINLLMGQAANVLYPISTVQDGGPNRLYADGNELYFSYSPFDKIKKFDVTSGTIIPIDIIDEPNMFGITSMLIVGTDLYYVVRTNNRIFKKDLSNSQSSPTLVLLGLGSPNGMVLKGNEIYVSDDVAGSISKFDITSSNPTMQTIVTGLSFPTGLALDGNDLYVSQLAGDKVSKIDLSSITMTPIDVITAIDGPNGLRIKNNHLIIALYNENRIIALDLANTSAGSMNLVTNVYKPSDIQFIGETMYISENGINKISKLQNVGVGLDELNNSSLSLYPNPTTDFIQVSNVTDEMQYTVFSFDGKRLISGDFNESNKIDVRGLLTGSYFVHLSSGQTIQISKR